MEVDKWTDEADCQSHVGFFFFNLDVFVGKGHKMKGCFIQLFASKMR